MLKAAIRDLKIAPSEKYTMLNALQKELDQRKIEGLLRQRRLLDSPQAEHIIANDKTLFIILQ